MSQSAFAVGTFTPGAGFADAVSYTASTFMAILGGTTTQVSFVDEIYMGGQAASTAVLIMLLGRDSTVMVGATTLATPNANGPVNPSAGVLTNIPVAAITVATTFPQRSSTVTFAKKNFTFNAFGGIVRANYANTLDRFGILGNTASLGEMSLSSFTGSAAAAAIGAHIIYETM